MPETLLLVPGLMCDETAWRGPLAAFGSRMTLQVIDHGGLDSLPAMAAALLRQAPPLFALAGHSMGGRVALEVMRLAPQRVTRLALLDTGCRPLAAGVAGESERTMREGFLRLAREQGVVAMAQQWVQGMVHPARLRDAALIDEIVQMIGRKPLAIYEAQIHALLTRADTSALLPEIRVPTLLLTGDHDLNSPPTANREMAAAIPGARVVVVEHCGHMAMQEQPAAVNAALELWLQ